MCSKDQNANHEDKITFLLTHSVILDAPVLVLFLLSSFHDSPKRLTNTHYSTQLLTRDPCSSPSFPTLRYYSPLRSVCVLPPIGVECVLQFRWLHSSVALLRTFTSSRNLVISVPVACESISNQNTVRFLVVPFYQILSLYEPSPLV